MSLGAGSHPYPAYKDETNLKIGSKDTKTSKDHQPVNEFLTTRINISNGFRVQMGYTPF